MQSYCEEEEEEGLIKCLLPAGESIYPTMGGKHSKYHYHHDQSSSNRSQSSEPKPSSSPYHQWNKQANNPWPKYSWIGDNYNSLDQVKEALCLAGLESSNLIVGIDFTKSNEWTGARSFGHKCLHHLGSSLNPYQQAISIIGWTLSSFDEDDRIPCYGFGDATTHDEHVFSFYPNDRPCNGFQEALMRYREIVPDLHLAGPTSFAPIIERAIDIVDNSGGQYHVLLIIADGQVTRSADTVNDQLSLQEQATIEAIVQASDYPLSIVLVGVGDGPWDMMHKFDDNIPSRAFDNFQFVNFTEIMSQNVHSTKKESDFALAALMEIPSQYKATLELQLLGRRRGRTESRPLPPPIKSHGYLDFSSEDSHSLSDSFNQNVRFDHNASAPPQHLEQNHLTCPVCFSSSRNLVFGCGHQTCYECGKDFIACPVCRAYINTKIRLYE